MIRSVPSVSIVLLLLMVAASSITAHKILLISDLHLDIYYGTANALPRSSGKCQSPTAPEFGTYGCDSPLPLITSMVDDIVTEHPDVKLTIFTGDWLRHDMHMEPQGANKSITDVANAIGMLPGHVMNAPSMAASLGNNDFIPDYYYNFSSPTPTGLMTHFADEMQKHNLMHSEDEADTFLKCGFYRRVIAPELEMIVLNSLIWSENIIPIKPADDTDPCGQFVFLQTALADARAAGRRVYIASHISPQVNFFNAWQASSFAGSGHFWQTGFLKMYEDIAKNYSDVVAAHFYGHTHKFAFMGDSNWSAPLFILPAISPIFGNTPSYMVATTNSTTGELLDMSQRTVNMTTGAWVTATSSVSEFIFNTPKDEPLTVPVLNKAAKQLAENVTAWNNFQEVYSGGPPFKNQFGSRGCSANCKLLYSCYSLFGDYHQVNTCTGGVWDGAARGVGMEDQWEGLLSEGQ